MGAPQLGMGRNGSATSFAEGSYGSMDFGGGSAEGGASIEYI
jgi:hypothetical protein